MSDRHPHRPRRLALTRRRALGLGFTAGLGASLGALGPNALSSNAFAAGPSTAAGGSPGTTPAPTAYPKGVRPRILNVFDENSLSPAERTLATTLQGLLARRSSEGIYLDIPSLGYHIWLDDLIKRYGVRTQPGDLWKTVWRAQVDGYLLFRQGTPSVNVATTLSGLTGAVAIEESLEATAIRRGLRKVLDVRDKDDRWVRDNYWSRLRHDVAIEQRGDWPERLRDYAAMAGAFTFFDGNSKFRADVVGALDDDATVIGWGDASDGEDAFIGTNSTAGVKAIPADHARNLSVLSGVSEDRLTQRGRLYDPAHGPRAAGTVTNGGGGGGGAPEAAPKPDPDAHYVTFLITDGDNIQWMLGDFVTDRRWFGSPLRGQVDLGWGISPSLIDLAPSVMRWYYDQSVKDRWVVGPSGGGYMYPSRYPASALEKHTSSLAQAMERSDLSVVQIIDFDSFPNTRLWSSYLKRPQIDGLIYLEYSRYDTHKGQVVWFEGKPVISARTMLWDGLPGADETSVIAELNSATRNPSSTAGYSVVLWHAWSKSVDSVMTVVNGLAPHVKIVPPDTLVRMVATNARP
ncbi:GxGYxY motif-containing protein [Kribbella sp. VKM Ac-2527]|uniref:GxGYxY motif-containing protein n=1 Tax=Kribbella caucasensis TaxID=2512215 RepID=A0A4R6KMC1_9ACTN|nr:GxGYxYP domain-containing protein [Kribbella sp. VKM Ac-2527]TDO52727.1 GxGYxY motif-containing protein [Kribbella sp. VKM Ac-2527]